MSFGFGLGFPRNRPFAGGPSLNFQFAGSTTLDPLITFTRASGATWFNSAGILQGVDFSVTSNTIGTGSKTFTLTATGGVNRYWTAGDTVLISDQANSANNMVGTVTSYNASTQVLVCNITSTGGSGTLTAWRIGSTMPRFDYNPATLAARGLLIEEARTNLLTYSDQFDNLAWVKAAATVTANATASPDGTVNADKLIATAVSANHYLSSGTVTISAGASVTASVYVKAAEYNTIRIAAYNSAITSGFRVDANLSTVTGTTGTLGTGSATGSSVTNVGGGWYRVTVSGTIDASSTGIVMWVQMLAAGVTPFLGDGTSGIFVFGAQLEAGAFPTSYIPTTTTALTRNADVASVNTLSPWFNSTQGTLYAEAQISAGIGSTPAAFASLDDTTTSNRIQLRRATPGNLANFRMVSSAGSTDVTLASGTLTGVNKTAAAFTASNQNAVNNGTLFTGITPIASLPTITRLLLGDGVGSFPINGWLRRVSYYPRRLSDAELQTITA